VLRQIIFGVGVECEVELHMAVHSGPDAAKSLMSRFAWATGVAMGIWVAGGISGGECLPSQASGVDADWRSLLAKRISTQVRASPRTIAQSSADSYSQP